MLPEGLPDACCFTVVNGGDELVTGQSDVVDPTTPFEETGRRACCSMLEGTVEVLGTEEDAFVLEAASWLFFRVFCACSFSFIPIFATANPEGFLPSLFTSFFFVVGVVCETLGKCVKIAFISI